MNVGLQATVREAPAVAVVGVSALFPGSGTTAGFWRDILEGRDRLTEVPRTHWLPADYFDPRPADGRQGLHHARRLSVQGGVLAAEFGLPPNTLPATDTAQLLALVVAKQVLIEATRGKFESMDRSRMSVVLGVASATELVAQMVGRLQMPVVERGHAGRRARRRRGGASSGNSLDLLHAVAGEHLPGPARQRGRRPRRQSARSRRPQRGRSTRPVRARSPPSRWRCTSSALGVPDLVITGGADTAQRHPYVHVLRARPTALSMRGTAGRSPRAPTARCSARASG